MKIIKWLFELEGVKPGLLMHNPAMMGGGHEDKAKRKKIPTPEEEAKMGLYARNGTLYVPSVAVRASILRACTGFKVGKASAATVLSAAIFVTEEDFPIFRKGKQIKSNDYDIDTRRAVVQRQGILRSRALIPIPWTIKGEFEIDHDVGVSLEMMNEFVEIAGSRVGLLDYRPDKKGWFGKFVLKASKFAK